MSRCFGLIVCLLAFSVSVSAQTGDAIFLQSYSFSALNHGIQAVSLCDDFIPTSAGDVQFAKLWMILSGGQPSSLTFSIAADNGDIDPNTASNIYSGVAPATYVDTGDIFSGYSVIEVTCVLSSVVPVVTGSRYWLQMDVPVGGYWLGQEPLVFGSTMWVFNTSVWVTTVDQVGYEMDGFFELYKPVALERNSWGSIKASF